MAKQYYVCFNDSETDPTYCSLDDVTYVVSGYQGYGNPCVDECVHVSVAPATHNELKVFAEIQGWELSEISGKLVLITNITK